MTKRLVSSNPSGGDHSGVVFYRAADLARRYRIHIVTIWKWVANGNLPPPIRLGPNTVAWRSDHIEDWERERSKQTA